MNFAIPDPSTVATPSFVTRAMAVSVITASAGATPYASNWIVCWSPSLLVNSTAKGIVSSLSAVVTRNVLRVRVNRFSRRLGPLGRTLQAATS